MLTIRPHRLGAHQARATGRSDPRAAAQRALPQTGRHRAPRRGQDHRQSAQRGACLEGPQERTAAQPAMG